LQPILKNDITKMGVRCLDAGCLKTSPDWGVVVVMLHAV